MNTKKTNENPIIKYFEDGCLCYLTGRISKPPENVDAQQYYFDNCSCSRNYRKFGVTPWDYDPVARQKALDLIEKKSFIQ